MKQHTHHENRILNLANGEVILLVGHIARSLHANLLTNLASAGKDAAKGVETLLVGRWNHFTDENHQGTVGIAGADRLCTFI